MHTQQTARPAAAAWLVAFLVAWLGTAISASACEEIKEAALQDSDAIRDAFRLTAEQVAEMEEQLKKNPHDLQLRTKLLGYYFLKHERDPSVRPTRDAHVLWLIEHHPDEPILAAPHGILSLGYCSPQQDKATTLWNKHIERRGDELAILYNAANSYTFINQSRAIELLKRASAIDPNSPCWHEEIGNMYRLEGRQRDGSVKEEIAAEALHAYEKAFQLVTRQMDRQSLRSAIAEMAMFAEQFDKAVRYARDLLRVDMEREGRFRDCQAIYDCNMVLAEVAFAKGDLDKAGRLLVRAGKTSGSPSLGSFGPSMRLARNLLKAGRTEPVIEYLEQCGRFWQPKTTEKWIEQIKDGEIPDFGRNLRY